MASLEIIREGAIARLWLDRPMQHNALSVELVTELAEAFHTLADDPAVRVAVLGGHGPSF